MAAKQPSWWPQDGEEPDPRWSLANERTLLAYVRTALGLLATGLAVTGSHTVTDAPRALAVLGLPLIALAGAIGLSARSRYLAAQHAMRTGLDLPPPLVATFLPWGVGAVAMVGLVVGAALLVID